MIASAHLVSGAAIGSLVANPFLAIVLAILSHFLLDFIPHTEYPIKNIVAKSWRLAFMDFLKVFLDLALGILLIITFSKNTPLIFVAAIAATLPDILAFSFFVSDNSTLLKLNDTHQQKIHFLKHKKIPLFARILSQIIVIAFSVYLLGF